MRLPRPRILRVIGLLAATSILLGAIQCDLVLPTIVITSPGQGIFTTDNSILVEGDVVNVDLSLVVDVRVNGASVALGKKGHFSTVVTVTPGSVSFPIVAELELQSGPIWRDRVTAVIGEVVADGDFSPMGLALRLNDSGLDDLETIVADQIDLDIATLLPPGTVLVDECFSELFGLCLGDARASVDNPPPTFTDFSIDLDSVTNAVDGEMLITDIEVHLYIDGTGVVPDCGLRLNAQATIIDGNYALQPASPVPTSVDVNQNGAVSVSFSSFDQTFTSGICDVPLIGDVIQLIIGDVEPAVRDGLRDFLADPDGSGPLDSPIADAVEVALAGIEITGPVGSAIGVGLEAPLFDVFEDSDGVTLDADALVIASMPDADAVDLAGSYHVPEAFPPFGALTPGGLAYDLALCISTSAFNQLLKAEVESGLLIASLSELDLGNGPVPITSGLLGLFIPELNSLGPGTPLRINIRPVLAPVITGNTGPNGEIAELLVPELRISLTTVDGFVYLDIAVDTVVGLGAGFDPLTGSLSFLLGELDPANININVLYNFVGTNEVLLEGLLQVVVPLIFPSLAGSLNSFPIPALLGLELNFVELSRNGQFMSLFLNTAVP
ncbi:MAG: hypothetical protein OEQ74_05125 [Gammaproteobacteria bacterium]|nr:hypothetical protein [Gammaproteobacteria bacterium]